MIESFSLASVIELLKLSDGAVVFLLLLVVWWKLDRRIARIEILLNNEISHRLRSLEDRFREIEGS